MKFSATVLALLAAPTVALNGGYLSSMGGGNAMKSSSFMPNNGVAPQDPFAAPPLAGFEAGAAAADEAGTPVFSLSQMSNGNEAAATTGDYLQSMGGSSSMKPSSFMPKGKYTAPRSNGSYLDNVSQPHVNPGPPPSAPYFQNTQQPVNAAPASSYLQSMGGGSSMKPSSFMPKGQYKTTQSNGHYLSQVNAPPAPPAPATSAAPASSYLQSMGGGSSMKPSSFMPNGQYNMPKSNGHYLTRDNASPAPPAPAAPAASAAPAGNYLQAMGGGSSMKASSFMPKGQYIMPKSNGHYLDQVSQPAPYEVAQEVTAAPAGSYLQSFGGGSAMKASNFFPNGKYNMPSTSSHYLDQASSPTSSSPAASSSTFSLSEMVDEDTVAASSGNYLGSLKVSSTPGGSGPQGFLDTLRVYATNSAAKNLPGYLDTLYVSSNTVQGATRPMTYLDNVVGAASVSAKVEAATDVVMRDNEPILAAINSLSEQMSQNHAATIGVLHDINSSMQTLVAQTAPAQMKSGGSGMGSGTYLESF